MSVALYQAEWKHDSLNHAWEANGEGTGGSVLRSRVKALLHILFDYASAGSEATLQQVVYEWHSAGRLGRFKL